jgi:hypothetical protein
MDWAVRVCYKSGMQQLRYQYMIATILAIIFGRKASRAFLEIRWDRLT